MPRQGQPVRTECRVRVVKVIRARLAVAATMMGRITAGAASVASVSMVVSSAVMPMHPAAGQKLFGDHDDLAFGVPFAEVPQGFGHLAQRVTAVNDCSDLSRLAELHEGRQVLYT